MARPYMRRLPFAPLMEASGAENMCDLSRRCGVHVRQLTRWKAEGLTLYGADRAATGLGLNPASIWPDFGTLPLREDRAS